MSPSVASPSDAMTMQALVFVARSSSARAAICAVTDRICAHNGVRPVGGDATRPSIVRSSWTDAGSCEPTVVPTTTCCGAPDGGLSIRNSVHAPSSTARRACQLIDAPSSSQRLHGTMPWRPPAPDTMRWPSFVPIEPELSMIQKRYEKSRALRTNCSARPSGMPMCWTARTAAASSRMFERAASTPTTWASRGAAPTTRATGAMGGAEALS
mmetsp:Transcript_4471/g.14265  ORF Transcript_4471/g.14265 Transcript_4471/m.14265 type:complete len:212 (+) Transcript_4471:613-1248(+)